MKKINIKLETNRSSNLVQPWPYAGSIGNESREILNHGDGVYVNDGEGKKLIDGPAGMWCSNLGHRNKDIAKVMYEQAIELSYNSPWYTSNNPAEILSRKIAEYAPGDLNDVFFTTGGSTAVESAIRFIQFYNNTRGRNEKKLIMCREDGYHGSTYLSASLNGKLRTSDWMDYSHGNMIRLSSPKLFGRKEKFNVSKFEDFLVNEFQEAINLHGSSNIAAFIGEPILASGGVIVPPENYFSRIKKKCEENEILFIADEVVTGFGRLGHIFSSEKVFNTVPDIITFAKGITSGYFPLGGVVISSKLMEDLRSSNHPDANFGHGFTYTSHPIGCSVALKNLEILENGVLENVLELSNYFQVKLKLLEQFSIVGEVRGKGLMACIECVVDYKDKNPLEIDTKIGERIDQHCQKLGLLLRPIINMCVLSPPLIINKKQIDDIFSILFKGIELTTNDLKNEGII